MGEAARTRYEADFTFARQFDETLAIYQDLLQQSPTPTKSTMETAPQRESDETASPTYSQATCVFCALGECEPVLTRPRYQVRQCPRCRVMWCDPTRFSESFNADNEDAYIEVEDTISNENRGRLDFLLRHAPPASHPRAVEIGCMHGDFVRQMREAGYEGGGLDLSESAVEAARRLNPGCVEYGTLGEEIADDSLDVVAAFNVIEHMDAPHEFLAEVRRVLRPGGVLVLETPKQESLYHHIMFTRGRLLSHKRELEVGVHPGTHIFKFGLGAWQTILSDRGFTVDEARSKSTPLAELLAKNTRAPLGVRAAIVAVGAAARITRLDNRILLVARLNPGPKG
jgi:2-polyprenyl-3-methyl-5-hydroxy-6-metoxy-1,4-benzoquinol methylase